MTAAIFLATGLAMIAAASGRRDVGVTLFGIALFAAVFWFNHHVTAPLRLTF
jgi:hypothetical protein